METNEIIPHETRAIAVEVGARPKSFGDHWRPHLFAMIENSVARSLRSGFTCEIDQQTYPSLYVFSPSGHEAFHHSLILPDGFRWKMDIWQDEDSQGAAFSGEIELPETCLRPIDVEQSPIVNLCSSGFVTGLERTDGGITALEALETHIAVVEGLRQPLECLLCEGVGSWEDPFCDTEDGRETCTRCGGKGKHIPTEYENLIGDVSLALLKTLATDLRAAYEATKGPTS